MKSQPLNYLFTKEKLFVVDEYLKKKYPNITHQPAILPNYKKILDIKVVDGDKEYWLGITYSKNEVISGDFEKKIPIEWREAVKEYIDGLKIIIQD